MLNGEGLLALMLILPRSDCTVLNVKHVIIPSGVSVEISHFLNKRAVFLCPAKLLLPATPAALPGLLGGLEPFDGRRYLIISGVMLPELAT